MVEGANGRKNAHSAGPAEKQIIINRKGKMKPILKAACVCVLSLVVLGALYAEQTGEIRGKVTDEQSEVLPGVAITAKSPKLQGTRTALSDQTGAFRLPLLPVGKYSLTFELPGFEKLTLTDADVHLGFTSSFSIVLKIAALSEEVTVTAVNPLIDKTRGDNSYRLKGDDLTQIPSQSRNIQEIVSFTPGVTGVRANTITGGANFPGYGTETGLPSFRGEGESGNNWLVDGLSQKGVARNDPGVVINYDAWDEIEIISDGFSPQLGQALGGFINIVTKSGGNEFHGEVGMLGQDRRMRAARQEQLSAASLPEASRYQLFGNLGGPILKDKLWFFASNNFHRTIDDTEEQAIGWLTIPAGRRRVNTNNFFGKITFTPWRNHTLSLSGTLDDFLNQRGGIGLPELYEKFIYTDTSYRFNYRGILSQDTLLTAALGHYRRKSSSEPLELDFGTPNYFWQDIAQFTNNAYGAFRETTARTDFALDLTHYLEPGPWGSHEFGAGFFYYKNYYEVSRNWTGQDFDLWPGNGFDNGVWLDWEAPGMPFDLWELGPGEGNNATKGFGFYLKDNVTIGRLSLMLGLRSEAQAVFNDLGEKIWSWGLGDFFSPRISLSFDLLGDGKNLLKFSYGRFANPHTTSWLFFFNTQYDFTFRTYNWIGGADPTEAQLQDPLKWEFMFEQSAGASPAEVDPDLKPNKATKYLLEFDRQLGINWALKIRGIYSFSRNLTNFISLYDPESTNKYKWIYTNFELKRRDYKALEVELRGKITDRFMLNTSYTWSQAKGTNPGQSETSGWNSGIGAGYEGGPFGIHPDVPESDPDKPLLDYLFGGLGGPGFGDEGWYGFLPYSVDHIAKLLTVYQAPYGINISAAAEYLSGYHWEKKGLSPAHGIFLTFPEGRGGRTTPAHVYMDLAVEKEFALRKGMRLSVGVNAYNLLNSQRPVSYIKEDTDLFGQVWARQLPRWVQFKAALRF